MLRPCHFCGHPLEETYRVCTECGRPNRTPKQVRTLGWVLGIFGLLGMAAGASQIRHGKVNRRLLTVVLVLGGAIYVGAQLSLFFL